MVRILCLPREDSFLHSQPPIEEKHPDWQLVICPVCGAKMDGGNDNA